ncbi:uncharacterized protein LOC134699954 [Mytilus trossulus]|uniref:uncharacterized protein LOC134699954 n=1 Tax=Mytilus trossulus TaxID=6551 RepID=UPI00300719A6
MTGSLLDHETFQIIFKESPETQSAIWKTYNTESCFQPHIEILGLTPKTSYIFKVRIVNKRTGEEFPFTDESELIKTQESPAKHVLKKARKTKAGSPAVYTLPIKENRSARNVKAKTRKFYLGTESVGVAEKTLMIVGATGSGKSTLINAIANYIIGVEWEDNFRFNLVDLEPEEEKRSRNEAQSLTQWVTCYTLYSSVSDRINYTVNLIDTPGFGDTRGLDQDAKIVDQIRELFTAKDQKGISTLDAVCFIVKAPDARLTPTQTYIFESILCLFGNDIKDNICTLITFADGQTPPVLSGIKALGGIPLPCDIYFTFNNSALYAENSVGANNQMSSFFWQMGMKSYQTFFSHVTNMQTRSLWLTAEVLEKRQKLENTIHNLHQEIDVGLSKINLLEGEVKLFSEHSRDILANKNFEYTVEEDYQEKIDLQGTGQHTTNCLTCNFTCHEYCRIPNDDKKAGCIAMNSEGSCMECPKGCHWSEHHNTPFVIKWFKKKVTKRYEDMKRKYEEATQKTLTQEQVLDEMNQDITKQEQGIQVMLVFISKLTNRLKEIALRPDPFSTVEYIDIMISSEEMEKKSGFEGRINALKKCRQRAQYGDSVQIFRDRIQNTRQSIAASDIAEELLESDMSIIGRIKRFLGSSKWLVDTI